jgi:spore coat polysaccharide biosynthesis protein SpsF
LKIIGIIQGRTGSTRFPNKLLKKINGKTLIELYIERVKHSKLLDDVVFATSTNEEDSIFIDMLKNVSIFRGSENDLLDRYYQCSKKYEADIIVRLTSDDAFVDPDVIDRAVSILKENKYIDFVTNHFEPTYPEGLDIEAYTFRTLEHLWLNAKKKYQREHVFPYVQENKSEFKIINFKQDIDYSKYRWTIDYECDYEMVKKIYEYLYKDTIIFKQEDIIILLKDNPEIAKINSHIKRKEGVNKSIKEGI